MSIDELIPPEIKIELQGKELPINFSLRNFVAIKRVFQISEQELINGLFKGDVESIIAAIWGSTLIFQEFNPVNPVAVKEQLNIEGLYKLSFAELVGINNKLCEALMASMPQPDDEEVAESEKK